MVAVNTGVGVLTALTLWAVGVANPFVWGGVAAILNFVPYLGPVITAALITVAGLASLDEPARALIAPAVFLVIHMTETNLVTPTLLGRHLPVNTVAIFVGLLFFGWLWGIPGAVLAVPLTVASSSCATTCRRSRTWGSCSITERGGYTYRMASAADRAAGLSRRVRCRVDRSPIMPRLGRVRQDCGIALVMVAFAAPWTRGAGRIARPVSRRGRHADRVGHGVEPPEEPREHSGPATSTRRQAWPP